MFGFVRTDIICQQYFIPQTVVELCVGIYQLISTSVFVFFLCAEMRNVSQRNVTFFLYNSLGK